MLLIRPAAVNDVPLLLRFFCELAEYERQPNAGSGAARLLVSRVISTGRRNTKLEPTLH